MASRQHGATAPPTDDITVIGLGIHVHGRIHGEEDLRIEGRVEGSISLTETVHVAESGVVQATIEARDVIVSGVVVGNVSASNSVSLDPGAKLVGDISAPRVIIADGASFRGNVAMSESTGAAPRARAKAVSRPAAAAKRSAASASSTTTTKSSKRSTTSTGRAPARKKASREKSSPRVAAVVTPRKPGVPDEEVTVVVRHAALASDEDEGASTSKKKSAKKSPPRARVPKRGKRRVNRR